MEVRVKCDRCGWVKEVAPNEVLGWHNRPCPQCGEDVIINDQEAALFKKLKLISDFSDLCANAYRLVTGRDAKVREFYVDSKELK